MTKKQILIVEDEGIIVADLQDILANSGYISLTAASGEEAIQQAIEARPNLVLMDIRLAGKMDGVEAARQIRACFDIPVIYLTAYTDDALLQRAKMTEPYGYLVKPIDEKELLIIIEMALYKHEMERKLKESEAKYRTLFETSPMSVTLIDTDGVVLDCNQMAVEISGFSREQIVDRPFMESSALAKEDMPQYIELFSQALSGEVIGPQELKIIRGDNQSCWIQSTITPLKKDDQVYALQVITRDITKRKRAEEALQYRLDLERLVSGISANFINCSVEEIEQGINHALKSIAEFAGAIRSSIFLFYDDLTMATNTHEWCADPADSQIELLQGIPFDQFGSHTGTLKRLDTVVIGRLTDIPPDAHGEREWIKVHGFHPLLFVPMVSEGSLYGALGFYGQVDEERDWPEDFVLLLKFVADILVNALERKRTEEALQQAEEKYRDIFENAVVGIFQTTPDGRFLNANKELARMMGYESPQKLITSITDIEHQGYVNPTHRIDFMRLLEEQDAVHNFEAQIRRKDGNVIWVSENARVVRDENGALLYYEGTLQDITERKLAEESLQESEERFRTIVETAPSMLHITDAEGNNVYISPNCEEITGYTQAELQGEFRWWVHKDDIPRAQEVFERAFRENVGGKNFEYKGVKKNGEVWYASASWEPLRDEAGKFKGFILQTTDITERKQTEKALQESEIRNKAMLDAMPDLMFHLSRDGEHLDFHAPKQEQLFVQPDAFLGKRVEEVLPAEVAGKYQHHIRATLDSGHMQIFEYQLDFLDKGIQHYESRMVVGGENRVLAIVRDITERKRMEEALWESNRLLEETLVELEATQEQIVQQERMAAVGQLAAGIAHDFNNILTSILGFAGLLQRQSDIPESARPDLDHIMAQSQRAAHLVRQILDFSRKSIHQPQQFNVKPFLKETARFLERTIPENIHILLEIEPGEYWIKADPPQLQQIVTNLAVNARDAMPAGGELTFRLSRFTLQPGRQPPCLEMSPGEWVILSVADTGTGIADEILPHILEPFFTTKEVGQGTGLGLAQVYGIVRQHQGYIDIESQVGKGSTFTIYLPAQTIQKQAVEVKMPTEMFRGRGETILLVEDEPAVLAAGKAMLEHLNYRVLTATNGQEALAVYAEQKDEIALVLADMIMPKMDGVDLLEALQAQDPNIKVVMMTGYPLGEGPLKALTEEIEDWLLKPIDFHQLAQVISLALQ